MRTQITGWDPSFNAITGLNGSGKSNILDAICFVLGITNMSSVSQYERSASCRSDSDPPTDARAEPARPHLQARPGRHHEGQCHHRVRQLGSLHKPGGTGELQADHSYAPGEWSLVQRPSPTVTNCMLPIVAHNAGPVASLSRHDSWQHIPRYAVSDAERCYILTEVTIAC